MIFQPLALPGAYLIEPERREDERGFFARSWCRQEFAEQGLNPDLLQCNISYNRHLGLIRGMHYQVAPHEETKLVRCTQGAIFDVILDLRPDSPSYLNWVGVELSQANHQMLYIPGGLAHGFQTLTAETEVFYQMSTEYHPESARGVRWDDPAFGIVWPLQEPQFAPLLSERDRAFADWNGPPKPL